MLKEAVFPKLTFDSIFFDNINRQQDATRNDHIVSCEDIERKGSVSVSRVSDQR